MAAKIAVVGAIFAICYAKNETQQQQPDSLHFSYNLNTSEIVNDEQQQHQVELVHFSNVEIGNGTIKVDLLDELAKINDKVFNRLSVIPQVVFNPQNLLLHIIITFKKAFEIGTQFRDGGKRLLIKGSVKTPIYPLNKFISVFLDYKKEQDTGYMSLIFRPDEKILYALNKQTDGKLVSLNRDFFTLGQKLEIGIQSSASDTFEVSLNGEVVMTWKPENLQPDYTWTFSIDEGALDFKKYCIQ